MQKNLFICRIPVMFILAGLFCQLQWPAILVITSVSCMMLPVLQKYQQQKSLSEACLEEAAFYMEQLIYCFRRQQKIPAALRNMQLITEGNLQQRIIQAVHRLEGNSDTQDMFHYAFSCIEQQYEVRLMTTIHTFLIRVEEDGGECTDALGLLLNQVHIWHKNQKVFQNRKQNIQSKLTLTIILSCLIFVSIVKMMPDFQLIKEKFFYQFSITGGLVLLQILYLIFQRLSVRTNLEKKALLSKQEKKWKENIDRMYMQMEKSAHGLKHWSDQKKLERLIKASFSEWLFEMILRLQTENVATAITHSLDHAPYVLVHPLRELIKQQQEDPVSITPYRNFLSQISISEIRVIMMQLYAINDMGKQEIQEQMHVMLEQNQQLESVAQELKMEDQLSGMELLAIFPMIVSVTVVLIQLSLMLFTFLKELSI